MSRTTRLEKATKVATELSSYFGKEHWDQADMKEIARLVAHNHNLILGDPVSSDFAVMYEKIINRIVNQVCY